MWIIQKNDHYVQKEAVTRFLHSPFLYKIIQVSQVLSWATTV